MQEARAQLLRGRLEILRRALIQDMRRGRRSAEDARGVFAISIGRARAIFSEPNSEPNQVG
jgi:hypothetical protein